MTREFSLRFSGFELPGDSAEIISIDSSFKKSEETDTYLGPNDKVLPAIKQLGSGSFALIDRQFTDVSSRGLSCTFQELTDEQDDNALSLTRRRNTHGLLFGQITLRSESDKEKAVLAVVKPFDSPKKALSEFSATQYVNDFSKRSRAMQGLTSLGFYKFDGGETGLITRYEHEIISYDNLFWDPDTDPTQPQLKKAMGRIAIALGRMHLMGFTHGDAQVKNFASDNHGVRIIDLESAEGFPVYGGEFNEEIIAARITSDVETFVNSLNTEIEDEEKYRDYTDSLTRWFIPRYISAVNVPKSKVPQSARITPDKIESLIDRSMS